MLWYSHGRFDVEDMNQEILTSESPSGTLRTARSNSFSYQQVSHYCCDEVKNDCYNAITFRKVRIQTNKLTIPHTVSLFSLFWLTESKMS